MNESLFKNNIQKFKGAKIFNYKFANIIKVNQSIIELISNLCNGKSQKNLKYKKSSKNYLLKK